MIGNITKGKSFSGLCKYILEKEKAELLQTNMVTGSAMLLAKQLEASSQLNSRIEHPAIHFSLSFAPGEKPDAETLKKISQQFLTAMGFENNLYFVASHDDRQHFHLHIGASRINLKGKCVSSWQDRFRCQEVLRQLEKEYNLTPVASSREVSRKSPSMGQKRRLMREQEEYERGLRDRPPEATVLEKLQEAIALCLSPNLRMSDFLNRLEQRGVSARIKISEQGEILGISYGLEGVAFPGRKLGRNEGSCTLPGLQQRGVKLTLNDLESLLEHSNLKGEDSVAKIRQNLKNQRFLSAETSKQTQSREIEL